MRDNLSLSSSSDFIIAPSLLSADFSMVRQEVESLSSAGATHLHLDVMDGTFVPNITFGHKLISDIKKHTDMVLDTHLMVSNPYPMLEDFISSGSDIVTIHAESGGQSHLHLHRAVTRIRELGAKAGIALNPSTHESVIEYLIPHVDLILIMTVNPGYGGQRFIPEMVDKVRRISDMVDRVVGTSGNNMLIEIDGGVSSSNVSLLRDAGANMVVAGNYIFSGDYKERIASLRP